MQTKTQPPAHPGVEFAELLRQSLGGFYPASGGFTQWLDRMEDRK
ncbi:MAG: hypothetical protein ACK5M4_03525 [Pseudorhodobacter sp.]